MPLVQRFAPLLVVLLVQMTLVVVAPSRVDERADLATDAGPVGTSGEVGGAGFDVATGTAADSGGSPGTGGTPASAAAVKGASAVKGVDPREAGPWPWTSPWLLEGDRSNCGKGGQRQDEVLIFTVPCTPRFTGDNGGVTYRGVTKDEIRVVMVVPKLNPAVSSLIASVGLWATPEQWDQGSQAFAKFFSDHYNFYGRRIKAYTQVTECEGGPFGGGGGATDLTCWREEAHVIQKKYDPFLVFFTSPTPIEFFDELSRLKIVNVGGWLYDKKFSVDRRPYHWDLFTDGTRTARNVADYWCKKMYGKPASRAGDDAIKAKPRRLGIVTPEYPVYLSAARYLADLTAGGQCGAGADRPPVFSYTHHDIAKAQEQMVPIVAGLKDAGVTTVACLCDLAVPAFLTSTMDDQDYFPEHLLALQEGADHDYPARLYSPEQWRNAFGPSPRPMEIPKQQQDDYVMWKMAGNSGEPPYVLTVVQMYYHFFTALLQWSGPNLTPLTLEKGAMSAPQIGGYQPQPAWPGWQGNDPRVQLWRFGPDDYTANEDTKEVYYDPDAPSRIDGQPGTYICARDCARTPIAGWTAGDPLR